MRGFDFALPTGSMVAYQAKLLEANMRFAFDFSLRRLGRHSNLLT
jgi:hypothetical protein